MLFFAVHLIQFYTKFCYSEIDFRPILYRPAGIFQKIPYFRCFSRFVTPVMSHENAFLDLRLCK